MRFLHSIRWRLQLWHGFLLALVLAGFGFTAWRLQWATQFQRIDQELERRVPVIVGAIRPPVTKPSGRPPQDGVPPPRGKKPRPDRNETAPSVPLELDLPTRDASRFAGDADSAFYFVVWDRQGIERARSPAAPPDEARPERVAGPIRWRLQGTCRECFQFLPAGEGVLVGRDIRSELSGMERFAWLLAAVGAAVFVFGLAGGWWISARALRPIADISATAARISATDLSQRIRTADTESELGQLAHVLNDTFARLQAAFDRQVQFTADAAHELRTPVSVVLTQTQTALSRERPAGEYRESLAACQRAAQRMRQLIESLLMLARLDFGEAATARMPCDLDRIAGEAAELLRPLAAAKGVTLEIGLTPTRCEGAAEQLAQVVTNLVSNAICYNRPDGGVRVHVAYVPGTAVLSVQDTGLGIASEDLPHIFERFYRADKARARADDHAGLGLSIAKAIVESHGGTVQVATELGKGSTFTVRLPGLPHSPASSASLPSP